MMKPFSNDNSYGLVIGVGQRLEDSHEMKISLSDAQHVGTALTSFCKLPNLQQLLGEEATCQQIKNELEGLANKTRQTKANLVVIYFSGHGCRYGDHYYLIGRDTENDRILETSLSGKKFLEMIQSIQTDKLLVLLDCCHAGGIAEPEEIPFERLPILESSNRVVITAGHKSQVSYLSRPVSIFTYALIEGLGGIHFLEGDRGVTVFDLAMYIRERVVTLSRQVLQIDEPQKPQLHVLENQQTTNFILARYANGQARKMFFEEDFSACQVNEKTINPNVDNTKDNAYREKFNWLNLTVVGDGNYLFTNIQNSTITINNGISIDELKEILRGYQPVAGQLITILENKPDEASRKLRDKIEITDIELLIENTSLESLEVGVNKFIAMLGPLKPRPSTYTFMLNLRGRFNEYKHQKLGRLNTDGKLEEIRAWFIEIIDDYKLRFV